MDINTLATRNAFNVSSEKMEFLTKTVHEYILESGYMETHSKQLKKAITKVAEKFDELLLQSFIGKLRHKLPKLRMGIKLSEYDRERAQIIASALITQILIDGGTYIIREQVERYNDAAGQPKFKKFLYIQLGGSFEKDLYRGIHLDPGVVEQSHVGGWKLSANEREFLSKISTVPFCISDVCTKELLLKGYSLKTDWDKRVNKYGKRLPEDPILKRNRYAVYAEKIVDHVKRFPKFYLSAKYCDRRRVYYDAARLEGMRPHGKLWETLMIDSAEPFKVTEDDMRVLKHLIYVTLYGRTSISKANKLFKNKDMLTAMGRDPFDATTEDEFGNYILLNKAAKALVEAKVGLPTKFMFGYDFTNSGLMMAGVAFRSNEMMRASNMAGLKTPVDSHTEFGKAYSLPLVRKDVKKIHTALLHGGTEKTLLKDIHKALGDDTKVTLEDVHKANLKAYGPAVVNITTIADWGQKVVGNRQAVLRWTLPDDFKSSSKAYLKGVPVLVYIASGSHKEHYTSHVVVSDMPLVEDKNGFPIFDKDTQVNGVHYPVMVKKRGLYANITHGNDAYMLRHITEAVLDSGRPILLKHDDFIAPPGAYKIILATAHEVFDEMYHTNLYQAALNEIAEHSPYELAVPTLVMGNGKNTIKSSENFLSP